ncbi:MAG: class I tRNA ligase family protein, partial [Cyclobacteriaceae bacterium]|nr:class I tRNA ligase family protein [Cyclobacteriaceae bacterium]
GTNADLDYFYPTAVLVTAPEILFFWVARMMIAGYEYMDRRPFSDVYLTGIVRDKLGRKMSKSLGNSPDPLELIANYGADGVRTGMLFCSPAGNDLPFDEKLCEQGRNFANKIWNAFRLVKGWTVEPIDQPGSSAVAIEWFDARFQQALAEINDLFSKYRLSEALMAVYKLIWDDFCAWYLEMVKPEFGKPIDAVTYQKTVGYFEQVLKVLHPFMPFITEELWSELKQRGKNDDLIVAQWPGMQSFDSAILSEADKAFEIIAQVRNARSSKGLSPKEALLLQVQDQQWTSSFTEVLTKLGNLKAVEKISDKPAGALSFMVGTTAYFLPMEGKIDAAKEKEEVLKEIEYQKGFLASVMKKLGNEKFVQGAPPQVIENERKKKADAESKIQSLEERLKGL